MSLGRTIRRLFSRGSGEQAEGKEQRYDTVQIVSAVDGSVIKGYDAVKAHFEQEQQLFEEHGSSIMFQVFRMDLNADTIQKLQGEMLAEIKVGGDFVSGKETVSEIRAKVRHLLEKEAGLARERGTRSDLELEQGDEITLVFNGRPMRDDKLFYADHYVLLPAWVQVFVHDCEFEKLAELVAKLGHQGRDG